MVIVIGMVVLMLMLQVCGGDVDGDSDRGGGADDDDGMWWW